MFGRIRDICIAPNGDVFIGTSNRDGRAQSPFPLPQDDRIIRIRNSETTGMISPSLKNIFNIYPNPSDGKFQMDFFADSEIEIYNIQGERIFSFIAGEISEIDFSKEKPGIYSLLITKDSGKEARKLVLIK